MRTQVLTNNQSSVSKIALSLTRRSLTLKVRTLHRNTYQGLTDPPQFFLPLNFTKERIH